MTTFPDFVEISAQFATATSAAGVWSAIKAAVEPLGYG